MSHFSILVVGKIKNRAYRELEEEYLKRLSHYTRCHLITIKDSRSPDPNKKIEEESAKVSDRLKPDDYVIILDEKGSPFTSLELAKKIEQFNNRGVRQVVLIVGGPYGISDELKKRAQARWSLSTLTLPHELSRVILLEQLYRAHTILRGEKYHH